MKEYILSIGGREYRAEVKELTAERACIVVNQQEYDVELVQLGRKKVAPVEAPRPVATAASAPATPPSARAARRDIGQGLPAPLPGLILEVLVREGDVVQAGQNVLLMEAMKMENHIQAPHNGTVKRVYVHNGDSVAEGDILLDIARPEMTTL